MTPGSLRAFPAVLVGLASCTSLLPLAIADDVAPPTLPDGFHRADILTVTFRPGTPLQADAARLIAAAGRAVSPGLSTTLDELADAGAIWSRAYADIPEATLAQLRTAAVRALGPEAPDLNLQFNLILPGGMRSDVVAAALEQHPEVRRAEPQLTGRGGDPLPPDLAPNQRYAFAPPLGINARDVHAWPGGTGAGIAFADIERLWQATHIDLPTVTRLGPPSTDVSLDNSHGTAVLGEVCARPNGFGTTGAAYGASAHFAHVNTGGTYDVARAIVVATAALPPGSIVMIEQQIPAGPTGSPAPMEWRLDCYNAIRTAVANGIIIVEAAGNGNNDLDAAVWRTGNGGHWPFLPQNDSGAIMVGAGAAPSSAIPRSRLNFSNYGSTVDLHGWGEAVFSTGYGDVYNIDGRDAYFTGTFGGTSSATPIVASACILLQSVYREVTSASAAGPSLLTPTQVRNYLRATGTAQAGNVTQNIGPMPDARSAIELALAGLPGQQSSGDCNGNGRPDAIDCYDWIVSGGASAGSSADRDRNLVPDSCEPPFCPADLDNGSGLGVRDRALTVEDLLYFVAAFSEGSIRADLDDGSGLGSSDGAVDLSDLVYFLARFESGC